MRSTPKRILKLTVGAVLIALSAAAWRIPAVLAVPRPFSYQFDDVLGTSLDLTFVVADEEAAVLAEQAALQEIERLRRILSTWDTTSEVAHLVRDGHLEPASPELMGVLALYDRWHALSGGAYSSRIGAVTPLWRAAEKTGEVPSAAALTAAAKAASSPGWTLDFENRRVTLTPGAVIDLSSLGKGFIIARTLAAARAATPVLRGALVDIGGDVRVWGDAPAGAGSEWTVAVADPRRHADNAPPLTTVLLRGEAVASSGSYERGYSVAGRHYSHILDARTGLPADGTLGVTVVAPDNSTANALATTLSVLAPREGLALVAKVSGAEALIVTSDGTVYRSPGFSRYEPTPVVAEPTRAVVHATLEVDLNQASRNRHRPYVAVWITDANGHHVRTLAFWAPKRKYQRELSRFWALMGADVRTVDAVTRATRAAGKYTLEWDGTDQAGKPVEAASYTFSLEAAYENGPHSVQSVTVDCTGAPVTSPIAKASAFEGAVVRCGSGG